MRNFRFEMLYNHIPEFREKDHIIPAVSIEDAIHKFARKHDLDTPAYWDEPTFDKIMELSFKRGQDEIRYRITWL